MPVIEQGNSTEQALVNHVKNLSYMHFEYHTDTFSLSHIRIKS